MGRFKIKKQDVFIDMTAMSDVTVLLLTFFMMTSTFTKKEPIKVNTPGSVSQIKVPEANLLTIVIEPTGKVFMSMDKKEDQIAILEEVAANSNIPDLKSLSATEEKNFGQAAAFGMPLSYLKQFVALDPDKQDAFLKDKGNPGIPCDSTNNEFKDWVTAARSVNPDLNIAIKADAKTSYAIIKKVMNSLQDIHENRYNLITSLKGEDK